MHDISTASNGPSTILFSHSIKIHNHLSTFPPRPGSSFSERSFTEDPDEPMSLSTRPQTGAVGRASLSLTDPLSVDGDRERIRMMSGSFIDVLHLTVFSRI